VSLHAASKGTTVLAGCFRNATAVAKAAQTIGSTFNVCPAGECWSDRTPRFAIEDWLAAGAVLRALPGRCSPEAEAAIATFERSEAAIREALVASSSGRELIERGYGTDVDCAAEVDVSACVPMLVGNAFVDAREWLSKRRLQPTATLQS
jgi:2-phosphosulfolactate phosphatase